VKVYRGIEEFEGKANYAVTTGTFDGVHIGHRTILDRLKQIAQKLDGESVLLTFYPHPRMVLQADSNLKLLNTIDEKTELLEAAGIDHLIIHPFTKAFSRTTSLEFVRDILVNQIGTKKLVIGYDHHFGRNREGSFDHLREFGPLYGFEVEEIPAQDIDDVNVSSTKIRKALSEGEVEVANNYLGGEYQLNGEVVQGNQIGRTIGYPTANLKLNSQYKLIPANGIYAVKAVTEGREFQAMLNIGMRPTITEENKQRKIEVHLFDFDEDLYHKNLKVKLVKRIRTEKKFNDLTELKQELARDEITCRKLFS